jgi:hypothetical protein
MESSVKRQPFLPAYEKFEMTLGAKVIEQRPQFVSAIGRCLTLWPFVEHQQAMLLGHLMKADDEATIAVFTALRQGRAQRDALIAAAEIALKSHDQHLALLKSVLKVIDRAGADRADIAHGNWDILQKRDDLVGWIESKHHAPWNTLAIAGTAEKYVGHSELHKRLSVVSLQNIEDSYEQIDKAWKMAFDLLVLLRSSTSQGIYGCSGQSLFEHLSELAAGSH